MKKQTQTVICYIPLTILIVIIPLIVKMKAIVNPLMDYSWYLNADILTDFFLYYKSVFVTFTGVFMLAILLWQISQKRKKHDLFQKDVYIFIPLVVYLGLTILSTLFSKYLSFSINGMPDQFETIWNLIAYTIITFYFYYVMVFCDAELFAIKNIYIGSTIIGIICALQYFKLDIYRMIYASKGVSFTFDEGTVYGPFYNINYVGSYIVLVLPMFLLFLVLYNDLKVKIISGVIAMLLLISIIGAKSMTSIIALGFIGLFAVFYILSKNVSRKKMLWIPISALTVCLVVTCIAFSPKLNSYILSSDTEKTNLESIYTHDDRVEINYKGQQLNVALQIDGSYINFQLHDQNGHEIECEDDYLEDGSISYALCDDRFSGIKLTPVLFSEDPPSYGFSVFIDDSEWQFSNQVTNDGTYYYYTDSGKFTKLTPETKSDDFQPFVHMSSFASGRGFIWNKTIALLKDYVILGSGADTFGLIFPNDDFVDLYNNGYKQLFITKPHNLYLQIAIQSGVLSLICFLVFYGWYFISSLRLYFRQKLDQPLAIAGFAIMLGTLGYMISGLANDSTITVAPLYWALLGMGIGINHKIRTKEK